MGRDIEKEVFDLAESVAADYDYELVNVALLGRGKRSVLRVVLDKEGGISLNDCEIFSRALEALLDVEDVIPWTYTLEVSSPGLDRPLLKPEDFRKNIGKLMKITTKEKVADQTFLSGRLEDVLEDGIRLSSINGKSVVSIPFSVISKAKLEIGLR